MPHYLKIILKKSLSESRGMFLNYLPKMCAAEKQHWASLKWSVAFLHWYQSQEYATFILYLCWNQASHWLGLHQ